MTSATSIGGVTVGLYGGGFLGPAVRRHPAAISWRITKKGRLILFSECGIEVARYKASLWQSVWLEQ